MHGMEHVSNLLGHGGSIHQMFYSKCPLVQPSCQSQHSDHTVHSTGLPSLFHSFIFDTPGAGTSLTHISLPRHIHLVPLAVPTTFLLRAALGRFNGLDGLSNASPISWKIGIFFLSTVAIKLNPQHAFNNLYRTGSAGAG